MKRVYIWFVLGLVAMFALAAFSPMQQDTELPQGLVILFTALGFGVLGTVPAALTNLGKAFGLVKDGQAPAVVALLGLLTLVLLYVAQLAVPDWLVSNQEIINTYSAQLVEIIGVLIQLISMLLGSRVVHNFVLKGIPLLGKSYSAAGS